MTVGTIIFIANPYLPGAPKSLSVDDLSICFETNLCGKRDPLQGRMQ